MVYAIVGVCNLAEQVSQLFCEAALLLIAVFCYCLTHFFDNLLLLTVKLSWNFQVYLNIQVTHPVTAQVLYALALQTEGCARLSAGRNLIGNLAFQGWNSDVRPQSCLVKADWNFQIQVLKLLRSVFWMIDVRLILIEALCQIRPL